MNTFHSESQIQMNCLFCKIINHELPATRLFENDEFLAINDISPVAPIHILLLPKLHIPTINDLHTEHTTLMGKMLITAADIAKNAQTDVSGYRLVYNINSDAQQTVFHVHLHILGQRKFSWPPG